MKKKINKIYLFKFYASDPTSNGFIDFEKFIELAALAKNGNFEFSAKKFCQNIFPDIDTNKDGHIDFNEFFKLCEILLGVWEKKETKEKSLML